MTRLHGSAAPLPHAQLAMAVPNSCHDARYNCHHFPAEAQGDHHRDHSTSGAVANGVLHPLRHTSPKLIASANIAAASARMGCSPGDPTSAAAANAMKRRLITLSTAGNLKISPLAPQQLQQRRPTAALRPPGGECPADATGGVALPWFGSPPAHQTAHGRAGMHASGVATGGYDNAGFNTRRESSKGSSSHGGAHFHSPQAPGGGHVRAILTPSRLVLRPMRQMQGCGESFTPAPADFAAGDAEWPRLTTPCQPLPAAFPEPMAAAAANYPADGAVEAPPAAAAPASASEDSGLRHDHEGSITVAHPICDLPSEPGPAITAVLQPYQDDADTEGETLREPSPASPISPSSPLPQPPPPLMQFPPPSPPHVQEHPTLQSPPGHAPSPPPQPRMLSVKHLDVLGSASQLLATVTRAPRCSSSNPGDLPAAVGCVGIDDAAAAAGPEASACVATNDPPAGSVAAASEGAGMATPLVVRVTVAVRPKRGRPVRPRGGAGGGDDDDAEEPGRGGYVRGPVCGEFDVVRYLEGRDCIDMNGRWVSRSQFEKMGGSAMAKWYRSIRVLPDLEPLGEWLDRQGMPVTKGPARRSRKRAADSDDETWQQPGLPNRWHQHQLHQCQLVQRPIQEAVDETATMAPPGRLAPPAVTPVRARAPGGGGAMMDALLATAAAAAAEVEAAQQPQRPQLAPQMQLQHEEDVYQHRQQQYQAGGRWERGGDEGPKGGRVDSWPLSQSLMRAPPGPRGDGGGAAGRSLWAQGQAQERGPAWGGDGGPAYTYRGSGTGEGVVSGAPQWRAWQEAGQQEGLHDVGSGALSNDWRQPPAPPSPSLAPAPSSEPSPQLPAPEPSQGMDCAVRGLPQQQQHSQFEPWRQQHHAPSSAAVMAAAESTREVDMVDVEPPVESRCMPAGPHGRHGETGSGTQHPQPPYQHPHQHPSSRAFGYPRHGAAAPHGPVPQSVFQSAPAQQQPPQQQHDNVVRPRLLLRAALTSPRSGGAAPQPCYISVQAPPGMLYSPSKSGTTSMAAASPAIPRAGAAVGCGSAGVLDGAWVRQR